MHNYHIDGGTGLIFNFGAFIQFQKYYEETLIGLWGSTVFSTVCQKQSAIMMFPFSVKTIFTKLTWHFDVDVMESLFHFSSKGQSF